MSCSGAGPASETWPARPGASGPAREGARFKRPRSVGTDRCRAPPAADALHHLSFPEIAGELFLSRNTIKSEAISIYRKLGASSRSQAVARSRDAGLLEG